MGVQGFEDERIMFSTLIISKLAVLGLGGLKLAEGSGIEWLWIWPLGGEVGNKMEAAMWELRRFMVVCRMAGG